MERKDVAENLKWKLTDIFPNDEAWEEEYKAVDEEYIVKQISKLGGTLFRAGKISAAVEEGLMVSASELNEMRRKAISSLSEKILEKNTNNYKIKQKGGAFAPPL